MEVSRQFIFGLAMELLIESVTIEKRGKKKEKVKNEKCQKILDIF